jgi:hypothetical protein
MVKRKIGIRERVTLFGTTLYATLILGTGFCKLLHGMNLTTEIPAGIMVSASEIADEDKYTKSREYMSGEPMRVNHIYDNDEGTATLSIMLGSEGVPTVEGTARGIKIGRDTLDQLTSNIRDEINDGGNGRIGLYGDVKTNGQMQSVLSLSLEAIEVGKQYVRFEQ